MKEWKGIILVLSLALVGCGEPGEEWLQDGFMWDVTQSEWRDATAVQRIGTAGLWLKKLQRDGLLSFDVPVAELKPKAETLARCINELDAKGAASNEQAAGQAIVCVNLLGWGKK